MPAIAMKRTHKIRNIRQLATLAAAARQEIVDVLEQMGVVSVAELAAALDRPADALYFHLRALTRAGLVRHAGYRVRRRGKEALYRTVAPELQLEYEPQSSANRRAVSAIVASMLRLATRDFTRSLERRQVVVSGGHRQLWSMRKVGRLSPSQLADVNRRIRGLAQRVSTPGGHGRLYAVTVVLTPLDHRNKSGSTRGRRGARQRATRRRGSKR
jgi:DNA-binding transcriptional ArsR family regulator